MTRWVAIVVLAFVPAPALAYCITPSVPYSMRAPEAPGSYSRPSVPYCLNGYSYTREHTCDQWELDSYFSDVEDYVNELQTYLDEINAYARKVNLLARDAEAYAVCEAEEVSTQHE